MDYIYGIVKDEATAEEFITKLIEATGENAALISGTTSAMATQAAAGLKTSLEMLGLLGVTVSQQAKLIILGDAIRDPFHLNVKDASGNYIDHCITFGTSVAMVVRHRITDTTDPAYSTETSKSNIIMRKSVKVDGVNQIVDTYLLDPTVYSTGVSNDCFAYCIMPASYGDVIVKLAGCNENAKDIELAFMGLSINSYVADNGVIQSQANHTSDFFLTNGPVGGFLITRMKKSDVCGIAVFHTTGSPLFIWSDSSHAPYEMYGEERRTYVNNGMGRLVGQYTDYGASGPDPWGTVDLTYNIDGIQQAALAPVFCPSVGNDIAKSSKWLYMSPHEYSSFDASQYIRVGSASKGSVYLCDHGVCALEDSSKFSFLGRSVPEIRNLSVQDYKRPVPDQMMPHHNNFDIYFDSLVAFDEGIKYNLVREDNDLITNGTVTSEGGLLLHFGATNTTYAYCGMPAMPYWGDPTDGIRQLYAIFKIKDGGRYLSGDINRQAFMLGQMLDDPMPSGESWHSKSAWGLTVGRETWSGNHGYKRIGYYGFRSSYGVDTGPWAYVDIPESETNDVIVFTVVGVEGSSFNGVPFASTAVAGGNMQFNWRNDFSNGNDASLSWSPYFSICGAKSTQFSPPASSIIGINGERYDAEAAYGYLDIELLFLASGPRDTTVESGSDYQHILQNAQFLIDRFNLGITLT